MKNSSSNHSSSLHNLKQKLEIVQEQETGILVGGFLSVQAQYTTSITVVNKGVCSNQGKCENANNLNTCENSLGACAGTTNGGSCNTIL